MPRACPVGVHFQSLQCNERESPRRKAVASIPFSQFRCSGKREVLRDKPVASFRLFDAKPLDQFKNVENPGRG